VLNLMVRLQRERGLTYIFVSHDLSVVEHVSDTLAIMYLGRIVEKGPVEAIYATPAHPYTRALLDAIPVPDPRRRGATVPLHGEAPSPVSPPPGCPFHPRCPFAIDACRAAPPSIDAIAHPFVLRDDAPTAGVALHRLRELEAWNSSERIDEALLGASVPRPVFELSRRQVVADAIRFGLAMSDALVLQAVRFGFASSAESLIASLADRFQQTLSDKSEHGLDSDQIRSNSQALEALCGLHGTSTGPDFSYTMSFRGT